MSRQLPPHANLEHLKKQSKELLQTLQQQNPSVKLAEAQYMLAREYGFASWPRLKAYVESMPRPIVPSPFHGAWTANLSKSRRHPSNPFRSANLEFAVVDNQVTILDVVVDELGNEHSSKNTIIVDDQEHPSENGYTLLARWRGSHALETVAKKGNEVVGLGTYEVSSNGQTMTISGEQQTIVLDRN